MPRSRKWLDAHARREKERRASKTAERAQARAVDLPEMLAFEKEGGDKLPAPRVTVVEVPLRPGEPERSHWPPIRAIVEYRLTSMQAYRRDTTISNQRSSLRFAIAELPERPSPDEVFAWMRALALPPPRGPGLMPSTVNRYKSHLSAAYEWARKRGLYTANPCTGLPDLDEVPEDGAEEKLEMPGAFGGPERAAEIYERARAVALPDERVALALLRFCGLTRQEIFGLRETDVDQATWTLSVRRGKRIGLDGSTGRLKTPARRRALHLPDLMPERERAELASYLRTPRLKGRAYGERAPGGKASFESTDFVLPWSSYQYEKFIHKLRAVSPEDFGPLAGKAHGTGSHLRPLHQFRHAFAEVAEDVLLRSPDPFTGMDRLRALLGHASLETLHRYLAKRRGQRLHPGAAAGLAEALRTGRVAARTLSVVDIQDTEKAHGVKGGGRGGRKSPATKVSEEK